MKIVYKVTNGVASDLRFEQDSYNEIGDEINFGSEDILPDILTLHDLGHYKVLKKQEVSENVRNKIAETYSISDELELARAGAADNTDTDWVTYNSFCSDKRDQGIISKTSIDSATDVAEVDTVDIIIT